LDEAMRKVLHILTELDDTDLHWTLGAGRALRLPRRGELLRQGEAVEHLHLLVEGELEVRSNGRLVGRLGPGEVIGEMSLLRGRGAAAGVTAGTDVLTLALAQSDLRRKLSQDVGFSARFHRALCLTLADRLERADSRIEALDAGRRESAGEEAVELDPRALGSLSLAHARFEWLLQQVRGR
jgi:CRP/FNR family cyclic AMP-dependent transcriptional regulator